MRLDGCRRIRKTRIPNGLNIEPEFNIPMRVAIIHYHLQPGGVTRIIESTAAALAGTDISLVVLTGKKPERNFPAPYRVIPALQYEADRPAATASDLMKAMKTEARDALGALPDLWHAHNHSLGKNTVLPRALHRLALEGHHLLLHIHDFAEDGRPANYHLMLEKMANCSKAVLSQFLYPGADHIHFGVLNGRDYSFLSDTGVDPGRLHLLPNPVQLNLRPRREEPLATDPLFLYPTRAIRRKNLGEFLLWAAVTGGGYRFGTTMGPENPRERPRYENWKRFASELKLPVQFELALRANIGFEDLLAQAMGLVTTSVAEGFGLAFLEPWLVGRPVYGRDLPEITIGFREEGIQLPKLYDRLDIPVEWIGRGRLLDSAAAGQQRLVDAYGRRPVPDCLDRVLASWIRDEHVDFGRLDEEMQQQVIRRLVHNPEESARLRPSALPEPPSSKGPLEQNLSILRRKYSLQGYGKRVESVYNQVANSPVTPLDALDGEQLLKHFLAPERLMLLRID